MTESKPTIEETLFRLNGTLMNTNKELAEIKDMLNKMNWNLGTIAKHFKNEE